MISTADPTLLYDPLTGLVGPNLFQDRLHMAMARARRHSCSTAVMFLCVDNFSRFHRNNGDNDAEALLRQVAKRLRQALRATDTVSHVEGEVFSVILEDLLITDNILVVVDKLLGLFDDSYPVNDKSVEVTVSLGVATFPYCGDTNETLISRAYSSLRKAKDRSGNTYDVAPYESQMPTRQAM